MSRGFFRLVLPDKKNSRAYYAQWEVLEMDAGEQAREALEGQYAQVSEALDYVGSILIAVLLSYYGVDAQKQQLCRALQGEEVISPELFPMQLTSATLVLNAVLYFFETSKEALEQADRNALDSLRWESLEISYVSNLLVALAAVLRMYDLLRVQFAPKPETPARAVDLEQTQVETEAEGDFPI